MGTGGDTGQVGAGAEGGEARRGHRDPSATHARFQCGLREGSPATSQQPRADRDRRAPPTGLWTPLGPILQLRGQALGPALRLQGWESSANNCGPENAPRRRKGRAQPRSERHFVPAASAASVPSPLVSRAGTCSAWTLRLALR